MHIILTALLTTGLYRITLCNSVDGWTESVRVNMLQEVLENRYLRSPVAVILDLDSRNVRSFKTLWYETAEQGLPDREILFYPVSERGKISLTKAMLKLKIEFSMIWTKSGRLIR